ncbi:uncharacterized protein [Rutidosis leptorrhynchoides]|uniref:uncharacterized protein n=1 Tax=Rutidosis leptorrhynchoides TaxID=125765 RepID=UPI003A98CE92
METGDPGMETDYPDSKTGDPDLETGDPGRRSDRIMSVRLVIQEVTFTVICAYAPHAGRGDAEKRHFWESLDAVVRMCPSDHSLLIGGDLNGHIGSDVEGYAGVHGGFGYGARNEEGLSILEFAVAHDLAVVNSFFKKRDAQLATFHSGGHSTQIDYLLIRKGDLRTSGDCKVLTAWTCSSQHRLLVMDLVLQRRATKSVRQAQPKILWKKLNGEKAETFKTTVIGRVDAELEMISNDDTDQMWNCLASSIREVAKETLGVALGTCRGHRAVRESWWFSEEVQSKVALKQLRFRELIAGGEGTPTDRIRAVERYKEAKREAKKAVALAKENAYEDLYKKLDSKEGANDIYKIAKARERRRMDLDNIKFIKNEDGQTLVKEDEIRKRWEEYFSSLFVVGRPERHEDLQDADIEQSHNSIDCERISEEEVRLALRKMGRNKSVGPDQIPIEAWRCLGDTGVRWLTCLFNKTFRSSKMPMEWRLSETIPIYKNKGDAQCCGIQECIPWCLIFTDDIVLVSDSKEELNRRLEQWRVALESNGLYISRQKTEYLSCDFDRNVDEQSDGVNICIGDQILHPQTSFRYLGSVLHKSGRIDEDVSHRIKTHASMVMACYVVFLSDGSLYGAPPLETTLCLSTDITQLVMESVAQLVLDKSAIGMLLWNPNLLISRVHGSNVDSSKATVMEFDAPLDQSSETSKSLTSDFAASKDKTGVKGSKRVASESAKSYQCLRTPNSISIKRLAKTHAIPQIPTSEAIFESKLFGPMVANLTYPMAANLFDIC